MTTQQAEAELLAEGELLLSRREEIERAIAREFRGTMAALTVQAAQLERQRDRVRAELLRIVAEADEAAGRERAETDEDDPGYVEDDGAEDFYDARERLVGRDRDLLAAIEALRQRARGLPRVEPPPALVDLEHQREQIETQVRQWRARCRRAGVEATLPRFEEYAVPDD